MKRERIFGTDGVRGVANIELTAPLALKLGMAAGHWASGHWKKLNGQRPMVVIGRDTRLSGDMLEAALSAGLNATGVDVLNVGVVPTPAVAQITLALKAAAGVVISASHNSFEDNGIKFFGPDAKKLPDSVEDELETLLNRLDDKELPVGGNIGRMRLDREPVKLYLDRIAATVGGVQVRPLAGLRIAMDCANGAAYELAPSLFSELGADLILLNNTPNGVNINHECGSTKPGAMALAVKRHKANIGVAFDGDADRVLLADENGEMVDGDQMMAIIALDLKKRGLLTNDVVVATIMSNVGLEKALELEGIRLHRTAVGDRYVAAAMNELSAVVGGEQSGHVLLPMVTPSGDGLVTALQVLKIVHDSGKTLSSLASVVKSYPQLLKSLHVQSRKGWENDPEINKAIRENSNRLANPLWLSVRASGTEPVIRVMAQGTDQEVVDSVVFNLCEVIGNQLGLQ